MLLNIFLVWFGWRLLLADNYPSSTELFLLGCGCVLSGVFALSSTLPNREIWTVALIFVGGYYFARAGGVIDGAWLARLLGLASIAAAIIMTYIAFPREGNH